MSDKHILLVYGGPLGKLILRVELESHNVLYKAAIKHLKRGNDCIIDFANGTSIARMRASRYCEVHENTANMELALAFNSRGYTV